MKLVRSLEGNVLTFFLRFQLAPRIPLDGISTLRKNSKSGGILAAKGARDSRCRRRHWAQHRKCRRREDVRIRREVAFPILRGGSPTQH